MFLLASRTPTPRPGPWRSPRRWSVGMILVLLFTLDFPPGAGGPPCRDTVWGAWAAGSSPASCGSACCRRDHRFGRQPHRPSGEGNRHRGLLLARRPRPALFAGKALANFCYCGRWRSYSYRCSSVLRRPRGGPRHWDYARSLVTNVGVGGGNNVALPRQYVPGTGTRDADSLLFPVIIPLVWGRKALTASLMDPPRGAGLVGPEARVYTSWEP